ncbi:MAG: hypothetical protein WDO06_01555 [Actinomycetota bacterium]
MARLSGNHPTTTAAYTRGYGTVLMAIDPNKFFGTALFKSEISEATKAIRATTPAKAGQPVLVPGDVRITSERKILPNFKSQKVFWDSVKELKATLSA